MKNLHTYLYDMQGQIDDCETLDEATVLVDEIHVTAHTLGTMRIVTSTEAPCFAQAIDADLEIYETWALDLHAKAEATVDDIKQAERDNASYGTYEQQVRGTYYGGAL